MHSLHEMRMRLGWLGHLTKQRGPRDLGWTAEDTEVGAIKSFFLVVFVPILLVVYMLYIVLQWTLHEIVMEVEHASFDDHFLNACSVGFHFHGYFRECTS